MADTYYVDAAGDDGNSGLSELLPFETYAHALVVAGADTILGNGGDAFRETVTASAAGQTFGAYGTGVPIWDGADPVTGWAASGLAALTGTATASITEADIVIGGKTIILTLSGDTWVASGATFDGQRQNIIDGLDSAQSEGTGWDAEVKANLAVTDVVRTSDTVVTITLSAQAAYDITATETITATIPSTAVVGAVAIVATPTFAVTTAVANEDFTDGTGNQPISWWMFEDASTPSVDGNATNGNDLGWVASAARSAAHVQGSYSLSTPTTADKVTRSNATLSANFPLKADTIDFTLGGWIYVKGNFGTFITMVDMSDGSSKGFRIQSSGTVGKFYARCWSAGGAVVLISDTAITSDGWHHVVFRWNGSNVAGAGADDEVSLWVDGVKQAATATRTSVVNDTASTFQFIGSATGAIGFDEWFAFDLPLLDTEIESIYAHGLAGER